MTTKQNMIDAIKTSANVTDDQAIKVLSVFIKVKAVKVSPHDGWQLRHGGFMDRAVILRALQF